MNSRPTNESSRNYCLPAHRHKLTLCPILLVFCSLLLSGCRGFGNGTSDRPNINAPSLQTKWEVKGGLSSWFQGEPTVAAADGKVYVIGISAEENKDELENVDYLRSLKADTGEEVWKFEFSGLKGTVPAVESGMVYFGMSEIGTGTYYLYCVDANNGQLNWRVPIGDYHDTSSTPIIADGLVYVATQSSIVDEDIPYFVYALDASTGREVWKHELDGGVSSIFLGGGVLYVGNQDGPMTAQTSKPTYLHALESKTGSEVWTFKTQAEVSTPPIVAGDTVYFTTGNRYWGHSLFALDSVSGQENWHFSVEGTTLSAPIITDANLYVGVNEIRDQCIDNCPPPRDYTDYLYTLDLATGTEKAKVQVEVPVIGLPLMVDSTLYSLNFGGLLYGNDASTGKVKWKFDLGNTATTLPVQSAGVIYVASWSPGSLYALNLPTATPSTTK